MAIWGLRAVLAMPVLFATAGACGCGSGSGGSNGQSPTNAPAHPDSNDGGNVSAQDDAGPDATVASGDAAVGSMTGEGGSGDAAPGIGDAAGADAAFGAPTAWVFNIVSSADVSAVSGVVNGSGGDLTPITKEFYQTFADNYDFIYLFAEVSGMAEVSMTVRWDGTSGVGIGAAFDDQTWGSAARLKQVISFGTLVNGTPFESGPTLHETLHHWSMYLDSSFGFDTATGHWGTASANGLHGGFDNSTVVCRDNGQKPTGTVPACPLNSSQRMNIRLAPFSPCCVADIKPYSPPELYLMGLVPASQVAPLWVMDSPKYDGPVMADAGGNIVAMDYDIASFHVVTIDEIIAKEGMRPPATQTAFRGAFVLVTPTPATSDQLGRIARWARRFSGEEVDPTTGVFSFSKATGGLATMTTRLLP
jgi:hypothetical protein